MTLMKSVLVRRPAKVDVLESHSGADTIPVFSVVSLVRYFQAA